MKNTVTSSRFRDLFFHGVFGAAALVVVGVFLWIVSDLFAMGFSQLSWTFLSGEVEQSGRSGGIAPILVSTFLILACCLVVAVPFGIGTAIWLSETGKPGCRWRKLVTGSIDLLASIPSIVFGLFGMVFFCQVLGLGFSILAGGLTLACMILPILVRTVRIAFEALPCNLRPAAAAVGLSRTTTLFRILLPAALPGIVIGITIGIARALSETAALIFTSGYATRWPGSLGDSGRAVSVHIYDLGMNVPNGGPKASASALVLLLLLLLINTIASQFTEKWCACSSATPSSHV